MDKMLNRVIAQLRLQATSLPQSLTSSSSSFSRTSTGPLSHPVFAIPGLLPEFTRRDAAVRYKLLDPCVSWTALRAGPVGAGFGSGTYVDAKFESHVGWNVCRESPDMAKKGMTPSGDDTSDVGETRALRDRDIGDEIAPAYPEQLALSSHVEGLQVPPSSLSTVQVSEPYNRTGRTHVL